MAGGAGEHRRPLPLRPASAKTARQVENQTKTSDEKTGAAGGDHHERQQVGARLAAFAVGCLGAATPAAAGTRLGLMGNASEEEFLHLLQHLEVLTKQRAAKLAGLGPGFVPLQNATPGARPQCSQAFEQALCEACGEASGTAAGLFAQLPLSPCGHADLLKVFRMDAKRDVPVGEAWPPAEQQGNADVLAYTSDFVESAEDLPQVSASSSTSAVLKISCGEVDEASWAQETAALNIVRAALTHQVPVKVEPAFVLGAARRCGSRRPALAKTALRAISEMACVHAELSPPGWTRLAWSAIGAECIMACFAAQKGTKAAVKLAEKTLQDVLSCLADVSLTGALQTLSSCILAEVSSKSSQAVCVSTGLRALVQLLPGISQAAEKQQTMAAVQAAAQAVLNNRMLAPAFHEARALLRSLKDIQVSPSPSKTRSWVTSEAEE